MAAAAYLLLPITGLLALAFARSPRVRAHGAQAIAFGLVWPSSLFAASAVGSALTQATFVVGLVVYLGLIVAALLGRDLLLSVFARYGGSEKD